MTNAAQVNVQFPVAAFMKVPAAVAGEMLAFGIRRLQANAAHLEQLMAAKNPAAVIDVQMKFAVDALGAYADEATKLQEAARAALEQPAQ